MRRRSSPVSRCSASIPRCPACSTPCTQKSPLYGSTVVSANLDAIKALRGVQDAFVVAGADPQTAFSSGLDAGLVGGVAIVADRWHRANKALDQLQVQWSANPAVSSQNTRSFEQQAAVLSGQASAADQATRWRSRQGLRNRRQGARSLV